MTTYGTTTGVAAIVQHYADNRGDYVDFTSQTKPTNVQLDRWLQQISSMFEIALLTQGFQVPVLPEYEQPFNSITFMVEELAATLVEGVNGFQRASATRAKGWSLPKALDDMRQLIQQWIIDNSVGLEEGGLPRTTSDLASMHTNDAEPTTSIFRRNLYDGIDTTR